jgi:hypothetical protein
MATQKLLLPYHFTRLDQKSLNFVIDIFGKLDNITVTVFNAYTPIPEIETDATSCLMRSKISSLKAVYRKTGLTVFLDPEKKI